MREPQDKQRPAAEFTLRQDVLVHFHTVTYCGWGLGSSLLGMLSASRACVTGNSGVEGLLVELCVSSIDAVRVLRFGIGVSDAFVEVALGVVGLSDGANESCDGDKDEDRFHGVLHRDGRTRG